MLSSAARFLFIALAPGLQNALPELESRAWQRVRPSVVTLLDSGSPIGAAACIDKRGYFLANSGLLRSPVLTARTSTGLIVNLSVRTVDEITQLVLLAATGPPVADWIPVGVGMDFGVRDASESKLAAKAEQSRPVRLVAVLPSGPARAEQMPGERLGVFAANRRLLPLSEVHFEATMQMAAGALVFNLDGELVGILSATLPGEQRNQSARNTLPPAATGGARDFGRAPQSGPGGLTVGYSLAPNVLARVVDGFRSPMHEVRHPSIGVFCKDAVEAGAEVQSVQSGSPAQKAGLLPGDIILAMGDDAVQNQIDFAKIVNRLKVGQSLPIRLKRGDQVLTISVVVGQHLAGL